MLFRSVEEVKVNNNFQSISDNWATALRCEYCGKDIDLKDYVEHAMKHEIEEVTPGNLDDIPLSPQDLPRIVYSGKGDDKICRICLMEYNEGDTLVYLTCVHRFHEECIMTWLDNKKECPICKKNGFNKLNSDVAPVHNNSSNSESGGVVALKILVGVLLIIGELLL